MRVALLLQMMWCSWKQSGGGGFSSRMQNWRSSMRLREAYRSLVMQVHPDKLEAGPEVFPEEALLARLIFGKLQAAHVVFRQLEPGLR